MDKTFKWTIPCNPKNWTTYVEKCEAEVERLSTEDKRLRGLIQEAMEWNWGGDDFHNIPQDVVARCVSAAFSLQETPLEERRAIDKPLPWD